MRPAELNVLFQQITSVAGVGSKTAALFKKLCGSFLVDLLFHLPSGVIYRRYITAFSQISTGMTGTLKIRVLEHIAPPYRRGHTPYRVLGECVDFPAEIELVFFNYHADYLSKQLIVGSVSAISGKIETLGNRLKMLHPDYIASDCSKIPEYEPVYPLTAGLTNKGLIKSVRVILDALPNLPEWNNHSLMQKKGWPDWKTALKQAHLPKTEKDLNVLSPARERLAYDELLANQLALLMVRSLQRKKNGKILPLSKKFVSCLIENLPFSLTQAQKRVIHEIETDLSEPGQMMRLLQGDVGSGKTVVALAALLQTVEAGFQGVLMAPTDILARQHFEAVNKLLQKMPSIRVALLTAREKGKTRTSLLAALAAGEIDILIGTHAVFTDDVIYHALGLAVVDEQHKFGVRQRVALCRKETGVNLLVMTATPIPRTLALTNFGDLDISVLDEKPSGREPIQTLVMSLKKAEELAQKLKEKIQKNTEKTQVYWVCPLVEESEKSDLAAAQKRYEMLQNIFGSRVGLVHGQMKGNEKDAVMTRFAAGEIDVLVATTVIEVGVDVPTATVMVIEQAERFGLAGLHQLRGRVGRGKGKSICFLLYGELLTQTAKARLKIMRETENGFLIAEEDLRLRGGGDILGVRQSGLMLFKLADLSVQSDLLYTAAQDAKIILNTDPRFQSERGKALRYLLYLFRKDEAIIEGLN